MVDAHPINPQRVFWELSPRLPDRVILTCDSGSSANWYARDLKIREGMMASLSGGLATMGPGVPYAIGAKFAHPDRPVIAMVGDGAFQMNGMNEVITIGKYWRRWSNPTLVILVLNNRDLNQVTWEQRVMEGDPKYEASQDIPDFPYARYAEGDRPARHPRRPAGGHRPRVGRGARERPADDRRHLYRSRRAAAAAAHLVQAGARVRRVADEGRSRSRRRHPCIGQGAFRVSAGEHTRPRRAIRT